LEPCCPNKGRTKKCTRVADRAFPDGKSLGRNRVILDVIGLMTPELQKQFESSLPPFDGQCIHNIDEMNLSQLREILAFAFAALEPRFPSISLFHDWHEHDGYIDTAKDISWISLRAVIENELTLYESRVDDFAVRIAIYSPTFDWLLRYNIDSNDESDYNTASCAFDLSASPVTGSANVLNELLTRFPGMLADCESHNWFTSHFGG
jgi:hypothetical protein